MSGKRITIGQVMMVVALSAVNLAVIRAVRWEAVTSPALWVFLGCTDFLIFWKRILNRALGTFHYTFLIVFVVAFIVMWKFVGMGFLRVDECWIGCFLTFALAYKVGLAAARLEVRRGWDIAAFMRGALVGFATFTLSATLLDHIGGAGWGETPPIQMNGRLVVLGVCLILGGLVGLSRLKSGTPGRESHAKLPETEVEASA